MLALGVSVTLGGGCGGSSGMGGMDSGTGSPPDGTTGIRTDDSGGGAVACSVTAPTVCPEVPLTYADISPIVDRHCVVCHYGAVGGPWPLISYRHMVDWYDIIPPALLNCTMPPADGGLPITITNEERLAILTWLRCGYPE
jgi:hypothetical protein